MVELKPKHVVPEVAGTAAVAVFVPLMPILGATAALVLFALLTDIILSIQKKEGVVLSLCGKAAVRYLSYSLVLVLCQFVEVYLSDGMSFLNLATSLIGVAELKTCLSNLHTLTGTSILPPIVKRIGEYIENIKKRS